MRVVTLIFALLGLFAGPLSAKTYTVDWTFGAQSVSGTITTNGRLGVQADASLVTGVDLTLTSTGLFGGGPRVIDSTNVGVIAFNELTFSDTAIQFDFDGAAVFVIGNRVATGISAPLGQTIWCMTAVTSGNPCSLTQNGATGSNNATGFYEFDGIGNEITALFASVTGVQTIATAPATGGGGSTVVPVPAGLPLALTGLAGLAFLRRRRGG